MILKHLGIGLLVCFGSYTMHLDAAQDIERNEFEILMQKYVRTLPAVRK